MPSTRLFLVALALLLVGCDGNGVDPEDAPPVSGRWTYAATDLAGTEVRCSTSSFVLTLIQSGSIEVDARFTGTTFDFDIECRREGRTTTLFLTRGTAVVNGEIEDGVVAFDFEDPDFLHTGTFEGRRMSGTVATRLDLRGTALGDAGIVNLVGTWEAIRR